jgi:hypothetical protein
MEQERPKLNHDAKYEKVESGFWWKPSKEEDYVCGIFLEKEENKGKYKRPAIKFLAKEIKQEGVIKNFKESDGRELSFWEYKAIEEEFKNKKVTIGDDVKIIYDGEGKAKVSGQNFKMFSVARAEKSE